jgi:hypothetical protein
LAAQSLGAPKQVIDLRFSEQKGDIQVAWHDGIIGDLLFREATAMIGNPAKSKLPASAGDK